jgi:tRNA A-37 threonylcarbamoyl transferase component Bud32
VTREARTRSAGIFGATRELDAVGRAAFLDLACEGDATLRADVEARLASDRDDNSSLTTPDADLSRILPDVATTLATGQLLEARYRVEQPLAAGGQAHVYRATDQVLGGPVVIKVMRSGSSRNRMLKARFEEEMEALSRIDHPGIVGILDVGDLTDGSPFLVIQYVNGISLRELLHGGPLDPSRVAGILQQLAAALGAAHASGVAHQDLKPENIMVQRLSDGTEAIKLIDFGIAKVDRSALEPLMTTIMVAGTVRYMAPEQFQGENSPACDIYALALVACEMLSGQPDIRAVVAKVNRGTRHLLESALALRPADRPSDISAWGQQVASALARGDGARRRLLGRLAVVALLVSLSIVGLRALWINVDEAVRVVEKVGAYDPLVEGFRIHNDVTGTVAHNADRAGDDGWRVSSSRQGQYYKALSDRQERLALDRGWTLTAVMRADEGLAFAAVDFLGNGKRYDIVLHAEPDADLVRLQTQLVPTFEGIDVRLPRTTRGYRKYELRFDPGLQAADLWIDGRIQLTGYRGYAQFQSEFGLFFGAATYKSARGVGTFQSVRFQINP